MKIKMPGEKVVGYVGSWASILGLLIAIPAFFAGMKIGEKTKG